MTARFGELEGHLFSSVDEFGVAIVRAWVQTVELGAAGRLTYAIVPNEALHRLTQAHGLASITRRRYDRFAALGDALCLERTEQALIDVTLICLLEDDHPGEHGWHRFVDAQARGDAEVDAAVSRIEARAQAARAR